MLSDVIYYTHSKSSAAIPIEDGRRPALLQAVVEVNVKKENGLFVAFSNCFDEAAQDRKKDGAIRKLSIQIGFRLEEYHALGLQDLKKFFKRHGWKKTDENGYLKHLKRCDPRRTIISWTKPK